MSCTGTTIVIIVDGEEISLPEDDFENAKQILEISGDNGDPTYDEHEENIANGNNTKGVTGVQPDGSVVQTTLPGEIDSSSMSTDTKPGNNRTGNQVDAPLWDSNNPNSYGLQLSENFKVKDFTLKTVWPFQLIDYNGISANLRCWNLKGLAINVAEPVRAKFGNFRINSGLRNKSTSSGISQHVMGEAFDIQFPGWTYQMYWDNAPWIRDNIPYDQFIFEHSESGLAWYHLSFKRPENGGNRPASNKTKVLTMYRNKYSPGLHKFY